MDAAMQLSEQPDIKKLFEVLESHGMKKEQQEVETLVDYIESMESQFTKVLDELKEVRGQLDQISDKGLRATAARFVEGAEQKVQSVIGQVTHIKEKLIHSARAAVETAKERGADALRRAISAMKIPTVLSLMRDFMRDGSQSMTKSAEKLGVINKELKIAGGHLRNAGRALMGKTAKEQSGKVMDKGILIGIQKAFLSFGKVFSDMEQRADRAIRQIERFRDGQERTQPQKKSSVRSELRKIKSEKSARQPRKPRAQEKAQFLIPCGVT